MDLPHFFIIIYTATLELFLIFFYLGANFQFTIGCDKKIWQLYGAKMLFINFFLQNLHLKKGKSFTRVDNANQCYNILPSELDFRETHCFNTLQMFFVSIPRKNALHNCKSTNNVQKLQTHFILVFKISPIGMQCPGIIEFLKCHAVVRNTFEEIVHAQDRYITKQTKHT